MASKFMKMAIDEARNGVKLGHGGPFGAVIVHAQSGEIFACEHNRVLVTNDPTMHAEITAIRAACAKLKRFSLHDCVIYSSCMPCPMCLSAIIWAKIPKLYYGASAKDAAEIGFDDDYIYSFIRNGFQQDENKLSLEIVDENECRELFADWKNEKDKEMY